MIHQAIPTHESNIDSNSHLQTKHPEYMLITKQVFWTSFIHKSSKQKPSLLALMMTHEVRLWSVITGKARQSRGNLPQTKAT